MRWLPASAVLRRYGVPIVEVAGRRWVERGGGKQMRGMKVGRVATIGAINGSRKGDGGIQMGVRVARYSKSTRVGVCVRHTGEEGVEGAEHV